MDNQPPHQEGNVNISGNLNQTGDIIGRDKIIHNIIVVGKVLDFAQIDGLIPNLSDMPNLKNISETFEANFLERLGSDLTNATSEAGEILRPILSSWTPTDGRALPFKQILNGLAQPLANKILELDYWSNFCDTNPFTIGADIYSVIWFTSLSGLWRKYKKGNKVFGLARKGNLATFVYKTETTIKSQMDFKDFTREDFRIFILGIVLELIRMASVVSNDLLFWNQVIDSLSPNA